MNPEDMDYEGTNKNNVYVKIEDGSLKPIKSNTTIEIAYLGKDNFHLKVLEVKE